MEIELIPDDLFGVYTTVDTLGLIIIHFRGTPYEANYQRGILQQLLDSHMMSLVLPNGQPTFVCLWINSYKDEYLFTSQLF